MKKREAYAKQLVEGIAEMEETVERLREEIHRLMQKRDELKQDLSTGETEPAF